jgi:hypothetical protein
MSLRIGVCIAIILFSIGFEEDPSIGPVRQYENVNVDAYPLGLGTTVQFEFANPYQDNVTLTLRLSNITYYRALMYTQVYQPQLRISHAVNIPAFLCDGSNLSLYLIASGKGFLIEKLLIIYPVKSLTIDPRLGEIQPQHAIKSIINAQGSILYMFERFNFHNFLDVKTTAIYGKLDLRDLTMVVLTPIPFVMTVETFYLLVPNHPHFEAFPLYQTLYRQISLEAIGQSTKLFQFKQMYVHPQHKTIAPIKYPGYVQTSILFLPITLFADFSRIQLSIFMQFRMVHHYTLTYSFTFEAMQPFIGHCGQGLYCVRVYYD